MLQAIIHRAPSLADSLPQALERVLPNPEQLVELRLDALTPPIHRSPLALSFLWSLRAGCERRIVRQQPECTSPLTRRVLLSHRGELDALIEDYSALLESIHTAQGPPFAIVDIPLTLFTSRRALAERFRGLAHSSLISVHEGAEDSLQAQLRRLEGLRDYPARYYKVALCTNPPAPSHPAAFWLSQQERLYQALRLPGLSLFFTGPAGFPSRFNAIYHGAPLLYFTPGNTPLDPIGNPLAIPSIGYLQALALPAPEAIPPDQPRALRLLPGSLPHAAPQPERVALLQDSHHLTLPCIE